jgi:DNA-binding transcriptional ArsR family regulator
MATKPPTIAWEYGTAYELFVSLFVLTQPDQFGIRPAYAAGVRSRIPAAERKLLEDILPIFGLPLQWIHDLPAPRDAITALWALKQIPPAERMIKLQRLDEPDPFPSNDPKDVEKHKTGKEILLRVASAGKWNAEDAEFFKRLLSKKNEAVKSGSIERCLDWWSRPEELGEASLSALQAYYQSFFAEEEKRLEPILKESLMRAQERSSALSLDELFVELSQGVKLDDASRAPNFVFAPAFWQTPLILFEKLDMDTMLVLYGARPADMSVIPGETVPDGLVRTLKALADPTRLRILSYLAKEELASSELAKRLKLRAPTVTHHMNELRLAGLVNVNFKGADRRFTVRQEAVDIIHKTLKDFLNDSK